jgi:predicted RNase H-like HicB family nuclease
VKKRASRRKRTVKLRGKDYEVVLTPDLEEGGYSVRCPTLPANTQGETEQEPIDNRIDAIEARLDAQEEIAKERSAEAAALPNARLPVQYAVSLRAARGLPLSSRTGPLKWQSTATGRRIAIFLSANSRRTPQVGGDRSRQKRRNDVR